MKFPSSSAVWLAAFALAGCAALEEPAIPVVPIPGDAAVGNSAASAAIAGASTAATAPVPPPVPYPFTTCAVIRRDLRGKPKHKRIYRNHEIHFCCDPCLHAFETNPEAYYPRIAEAAAARARGEPVHSGW
jgi:YHS domain-containing protein